VLEILRTTLSRDPGPEINLADAIRRRFKRLGGTDLPDGPREAMREPFRSDD